MASSQSGVDINTVQNISTRNQLIALNPQMISSDKANGQLTETYKFQNEKGSIARAFMHGLLDLATGFLWELAGTPIESALGEKKFYTVKVVFDENEHIQKMELN